jgi:hypothetical protein
MRFKNEKQLEKKALKLAAYLDYLLLGFILLLLAGGVLVGVNYFKKIPYFEFLLIVDFVLLAVVFWAFFNLGDIVRKEPIYSWLRRHEIQRGKRKGDPTDKEEIERLTKRIESRITSLGE